MLRQTGFIASPRKLSGPGFGAVLVHHVRRAPIREVRLNKHALSHHRAGERPIDTDGSPSRAALVAREGIVFTNLYANHLIQAYGLQVFTAFQESEVRRCLDGHPEIAFMLIDNRFPDAQGIDRDSMGLALAIEYNIPTILVTGGPVFSQPGPLIACIFTINWPNLEAATRWVWALVQRRAASRTDAALVAESSARLRQSSIELYRELAREQPAPTGFQSYEPIDERLVRELQQRPSSNGCD